MILERVSLSVSKLRFGAVATFHSLPGTAAGWLQEPITPSVADPEPCLPPALPGRVFSGSQGFSLALGSECC